MVKTIDSMQRAVLGIDLGDTKLSGALFSIDGEPIHSSGKTLFELADIVVDTCVPANDASVPLKDHMDKKRIHIV